MEISESAHRLIWLGLEADDSRAIIDMVRISRGGLDAQTFISYSAHMGRVSGTLLQLACRYSNMRLIEFLLDLPGTDVNYLGKSECTPMFKAMLYSRDDFEILRVISLFEKSGKPLRMDEMHTIGGGGVSANYLGLSDWSNSLAQVPLKLMKMGARDKPRCVSFHHRASVIEEDSFYLELHASRIVVLAALEAQYQSKRRWMPLELWQRLLGMLRQSGA